MAPPSGTIRKFACSHCSKAFGRVEHLKRHELIHTKQTSFPCRFCGKAFVRRDALQRHESTHSSALNLLQRGARACAPCAAAKTRCSGEEQCSRCQDRRLQCEYPRTSTGLSSSDKQRLLETPLQDLNPSPDRASASGSISGLPTSMPDASACNLDFWEPGLLPTTNWLDALNDEDFTGFSMPFDQPEDSSPSHSMEWTMSASNINITSTPTRVDSESRPPQSNGYTTAILSPSSLEGSAATSDSISERGLFYVDGEPTRLAKSARRVSFASSSETLCDKIKDFSLALHLVTETGTTHAHIISINTRIYSQIQSWYEKLCIAPNPMWSSFQDSGIPPMTVLQHLVWLYFARFDQHMPLVHYADINDGVASALLTLSLAAIGSVYLAKSELTHCFAISMQEFLRRVLFFLPEHATSKPEDTNDLNRARILNIIGLAYSGDKRLLTCALEDTNALANIHCTAFRAVGQSRDGIVNRCDHNNAEDRWRSWIRCETNVRISHAAWLVGSMFKYHFEIDPPFHLSTATQPLPCEDKLWAANTHQEWVDLAGGQGSTTLSLRDALSELYTDKRLPKLDSEFANILIIHGIFHRSWDVEKYFQDPLSSWEPVAQRQRSIEVLPRIPIWLPSIPTFAKWQNSACDSIDVLHWQANATIGQASGLEHPTVLHLHIARVVLLVPYTNIIAMAKAINAHSEVCATDRDIVQRWATEHQFKARLAAIHAGVTLWHVRRHSVDAFYEAPAVALATLTLWAFGTFSKRRVAAPRQAIDAADGEISDIILLDRPTDDELVQHFIRNGSTMRAYLSGVGDLYEIHGPLKVLIQGSKVLRSLASWGVRTHWLKLICGLADSGKLSL